MRLAHATAVAALVAACAAPTAAVAHPLPTSSASSAKSLFGFAHTGLGSTRPVGLSAAGGTNVPVAMSPNVRLRSTFPGVRTIAGVFATTGSFFYASGLDSVTVFDTTDPAAPKAVGVLPQLEFENEAVSYGERRVGDKLERYVLVGNDLYNASASPSSAPTVGRVGGRELIVVDVTDPAKPFVRGRANTTTSTHTVKCADRDCTTVYAAGNGGKFSVIDMTDPSKPKEVGTVASRAAAGGGAFGTGSGHHWDIDAAGIAWHVGSGGVSAFDISDLRKPVEIAQSGDSSRKGPLNDFILHNAQHPNAEAFDPRAPAQEPSLRNGNVLLVTEEDYENTDCATAGSFQTWQITALSGKDAIKNLDRINPVTEGGGGASTPRGAFCSAHWFDTSETGIVALGAYAGGLRFIDVRDPRDIKQYGYFTGGASEVWDAYFVPERDKDGRATGRKTNIVYTADPVRGIDVVEVDLPAAPGAARSATRARAR